MARTTVMLKGAWMDDGFITSRRPLMVEVTSMGHLYDPDTGGALTVRREKVTSDIHSIEISNGCWVFSPDEGECERVGAVVES